MVFRNVSTAAPVIDYLANTIITLLANGKRVAWFVTGGSGIPLEVEVSKRIAGKELGHLMVTLSDERFGSVGHADSNWQQLQEGGFALPGAEVVPVLYDATQQDTVAAYNQTVRRFIETADYKLGFFGMGADGHVAGILPESAVLESQAMADIYDAGSFTRITMTPFAISQLDEAVLYATGESKRTALENLTKDLIIANQPAQILKQLHTLTIFNDQIGETL